MKTNLLCLLALLLLLGCKKSESGPELAGLCRLVEVKKEGPEPWRNWQLLSYDEHGRLAVMKSPSEFGVDRFETIKISYDSEGRRKEMTRELTDSQFFDKVTYRYGTNGQIDAVDFQEVNRQDGTAIPGGSFVHTYSGGKLSSITHRAIINGQEEDYRLYTYTFSGSTLIRREEYNLDEPDAHRTVTLLTYDDKKRPTFIGLMPEENYGTVYITDFMMPTGEHNVLSYEREYHHMGQVYTSLKYQNTYTYNSQGYPLRQVQKLHNGQEHRFTYTYACD